MKRCTHTSLSTKFTQSGGGAPPLQKKPQNTQRGDKKRKEFLGSWTRDKTDFIIEERVLPDAGVALNYTTGGQ